MGTIPRPTRQTQYPSLPSSTPQTNPTIGYTTQAPTQSSYKPQYTLPQSSEAHQSSDTVQFPTTPTHHTTLPPSTSPHETSQSYNLPSQFTTNSGVQPFSQPPPLRPQDALV